MTVLSHADDLVASFHEAVRRAGDIALGFFRPGQRTTARVTHKEGGSPVTEADLLVDAFLRTEFARLLPDAGWLSEETEDSEDRLTRSEVLVLDPIDGTRAFALGEKTWAVAAALVRDGRPQIGIVHAPALKQSYVAVRGAGARLNGAPIQVSQLAALEAGSKVGAPMFLAEELRLAGLKFSLQPRVPSLAMRIVYVASGTLDAGFASENSNDWDIAAADLILEEAGGRLASLDGCDLVYNRVETRHGLLAAAPLQIYPAINHAMRRTRNAFEP
ncbi:inositol monophosphatase [Methylocella silvestris BL2]|uniref:Inositol monophosphatase n=1 Tax=Methylocella silvestris (strain DSM 15510 / CIP 108128 / LMG 27833 / NCIMB 13906 / BL2) TaxID=395965 RepID=B8EL58_METSB|nr:3'(2'),5'-bisphosphate nucleotidase CysQ [Methylocella silvestris]ACK49053.1 inositol monophosphatase [Methylocella silvestris BL2]